MAYVPQQFSNIGKSVKDLFKQKYDFDTTVKSIRKTNTGETLEAGGVWNRAGAGRGYLKISKPAPQYTVDAQIHTDASQETKAALKFAKIATGAVLTTTVTTKDDDFKGSTRPIGIVEGTYAADKVATTLTVKSNLFEQIKGKAAVTVGADGFSVGASVGVDASRGVSVSDYNFGAQYDTRDYTASLFTEKRAEVVNASIFHRPSVNQIIGATVKTDLHFSAPKVTLGTDYKLNAYSNIRAKVDLPENTVTAAYEYKSADPQLSVGLAATFKPTEFAQVIKANNFGVTVTFGDY